MPSNLLSNETETTTATVQTAFETGITQVKNDSLGLVGIALPVGLAIMGIFFTIKKGVKFFKTVSN